MNKVEILKEIEYNKELLVKAKELNKGKTTFESINKEIKKLQNKLK